MGFILGGAIFIITIICLSPKVGLALLGFVLAAWTIIFILGFIFSGIIIGIIWINENIFLVLGVLAVVLVLGGIILELYLKRGNRGSK